MNISLLCSSQTYNATNVSRYATYISLNDIKTTGGSQIFEKRLSSRMPCCFVRPGTQHLGCRNHDSVSEHREKWYIQPDKECGHTENVQALQGDHRILRITAYYL